MDGVGTPEIPKTLSSFPISKEAVDMSLSALSDNPRDFIRMGDNILKDNLEFREFTVQMARVIPEYSGSYILGSTYVLRAISEQAVLSGSSIPKVSEDLINEYIEENEAKMKKQEETRAPEASMDDDTYLENELTKLEKIEPELVRGVREISKYRQDRKAYHRAAINVYEIIRKAEEKQKHT